MGDLKATAFGSKIRKTIICHLSFKTKASAEQHKPSKTARRVALRSVNGDHLQKHNHIICPFTLGSAYIQLSTVLIASHYDGLKVTSLSCERIRY